MFNLAKKDKLNRELVSKREIERLQHVSLKHDLSITVTLKEKIDFILNRKTRSSSLSFSSSPTYLRTSSLTRVRNRCIETGRARANIRIAKLSRIRFRELASKGALNGIMKASW